MWKRSDLLHPATVLSATALFVSLGGVTYAAATIGTKDLKAGAVTRAKISNRAVSQSKLATGAVTTEKLATGAVTPTKLRAGAVTAGKLSDAAIQSSNLQDGAVVAEKLASGAVTAAKLAPGIAVAGRGAITPFHTKLAVGETKTLLTLPGIGTIASTCTAGKADTQFRSDAAVTMNLRTSASSGTTFTDGFSPPGFVTILPNPGGDQSVQIQAGYAGADGTPHVATIDLTHALGCTAYGQAVSTG